jgi:hypothetical protein
VRRSLSEWAWTAVALFGRNWITLFGATLTTVAAILIIAFFLMGLLQLTDSPYIGIMAFLVMPGLFVFGLLLIPLGLYWERKRGGPAEEEESGRRYPLIDFNKPRVRRVAALVGALTLTNLLIISLATYEGVNYMDSVEFCGTVCHTVMEPQHEAYVGSPHSRVKCVECHIGPGAPWFVRSKLSGVGQVFAVTFDTYARPIPVPVENLRPSRDTCEECHWPEKFTGDRVRVFTRYGLDEVNTPYKSVLLMHIGGGSMPHTGGIHSWHVDPNKETWYIAADDKREEIVWIQVREVDGTVTEYKGPGFDMTPEQVAAAPKRMMDCIDCHNRPTHIFRLPDIAIDEALDAGALSASVPFVKRAGIQVLREAQAAHEVAPLVHRYYQENHPDFYSSHRAEVERTAAALASIHSRNVFPRMNLTWGTYPDHIGHEQAIGCFRCHTGEHASDNGRTIEQDCSSCHTLLAHEEHEPDILRQLQIQ